MFKTMTLPIALSLVIASHAIAQFNMDSPDMQVQRINISRKNMGMPQLSQDAEAAFRNRNESQRKGEVEEVNKASEEFKKLNPNFCGLHGCGKH